MRSSPSSRYLLWAVLIGIALSPCIATASLASSFLTEVHNPLTELEIGNNDQRISDMGTDGLDAYGANYPEIAYDSVNNRALVVWQGDDDTGDLENNAYEVFGQLIDASDGSEIGEDVRISFMGADDGDDAFSVRWPAIAYNSLDQEYLVVWSGRTDTLDTADEEREIFGQRVGADGSLKEGNFRISHAGPDGSEFYEARHAAIAHNPTANQYLVAWRGSDDEGALDMDEYEIFGQLLDHQGGALGSQLRISQMGNDGNPDFRASFPDVAYNEIDDRYIVVWEGKHNAAGLGANEYEVYGALLESDGTIVTSNNRLTHSGPDGDDGYYVITPEVAHNTRENEYLVVWEGEDQDPEEVEIFGQRVQADGTPLGEDFQISHMGPEGSPDYVGIIPNITYNSDYNEYLVAWMGDDDTPPLLDEEYEIYVQRLDARGRAIGENLRISDMGGLGALTYEGDIPRSIYNPKNRTYIVVWDGIDDLPGLGGNESEIYLQRLRAPTCGDGEYHSGAEECDDGNTDDGDGCSAACILDAADDLSAENVSLDFTTFILGESYALESPDPRAASTQAINLKAELPSSCACEWSVDASRDGAGTFDDTATCQTTFTPTSLGTGRMQVIADCGLEGDRVFRQDFTVITASSSVDDEEGGGCSLTPAPASHAWSFGVLMLCLSLLGMFSLRKREP